MSTPTTKQPCQGWTSRRDFRNNLPCGNNAQPGKQYCKVHDPDLHDAREAARMERYKAKRDRQQIPGSDYNSRS